MAADDGGTVALPPPVSMNQDQEMGFSLALVVSLLFYFLLDPKDGLGFLNYELRGVIYR